MSTPSRHRMSQPRPPTTRWRGCSASAASSSAPWASCSRSPRAAAAPTGSPVTGRGVARASGPAGPSVRDDSSTARRGLHASAMRNSSVGVGGARYTRRVSWSTETDPTDEVPWNPDELAPPPDDEWAPPPPADSWQPDVHGPAGPRDIRFVDIAASASAARAAAVARRPAALRDCRRGAAHRLRLRAVPRRAGRRSSSRWRAAATPSCSCPPAAARASATRSRRCCARARASWSRRSSRSCTTRSTRSSATACARPTSTRASRPSERAAVERAYLAGELDLLYIAPERLEQRGDQALPRSAARSRSSPSTRRTAWRSGATTSGPTTSRSPSSPSAGPTCRASPSPPRPPRRRTARSPQRLSLRGRDAVRLELRPAQHPVPHRAQARGAQAAARLRAQRGRRCSRHARRGHRLRALAREHREDRGVPRRQRRQRAAVSRGPRRGACAGARRSASSAKTASSSSRRSRSAWASTSPTCASSPTSTCRSRSRATTRRPAAPAATALPATAWLAYGLQDVVQQRRMIDESPGDLAHRRRLAPAPRRDARALRDRARAAGRTCSATSARPASPCGNCDTCLEPPAVVGRHGAGAEAHVDDRAPAARAQPALRRRPPHRHPARQRDPARRQYGHDALATWGIGQDLSEQQWRGVVRQLLAQGLLATHGEYGTLTRHRCRGRRCSRARAPGDAPHRARAARSRSRGAARRHRPRPTSSPARPSCSSSCARGARARPASRACPPTSCSATRPCAPSPSRGPTRLGDLDGITGIGAKKLEAYGEALLAVVAAA